MLRRPPTSYAPGECGKVDQASDYSQTEAVEDFVRIVHAPPGLRYEEPLGLPQAVAVDGEGLADFLPRLLRPAQDAPGVTRRVEAVAAEILVHQVLVRLRRGTTQEPKGEARLRSRSGLRPQDEQATRALGLYPESCPSPQCHRVFQPPEEALGETAGLIP